MRSDFTVPTGQCTIGVKFLRKDNKGTITLLIDGKECGFINVPSVLRMISASGLQIGRNNLSPVTNDYRTPFEFKGTIKNVKFKLLSYKPKPDDNQNRFDAEMAKQ